VSNRSLRKIKDLQNCAGLIFSDHRNLKSSLLDSKRGSLYFCAHTGTSMYPTLNEMDVLEIEPYGSRPIRAGDVIFFLSPEGCRPAVHRVASVIAGSVQTKGDNNSSIDPWFIRPEDVLGRVVRATRGKKRRPIYGGRVGQQWSFWVRNLKVVEKGLSFLYHRLARSGFLRRLVPLHKRMRIVALRRKGGRTCKLLLGNRVIGNCQPGMTYWQIRRPFRLFVDVESLPK
jgi:signal peptidase I